MAEISRTSGIDDARRRCFWAALLEPRSERRLAALVDELRTAAGRHWRWIPRRNWHLTLHFLGPIYNAQAAALGEALGARPLTAPLTLRLRQIGPFPDRRPRLLAARLEGAAALTDWVEFLQAASAAVGLPAEERTFHAHLTVARSGRGRLDRFPQLPALADLKFDRIVLMRSEMGPGGSRYLPLAVKAAGS